MQGQQQRVQTFSPVARLDIVRRQGFKGRSKFVQNIGRHLDVYYSNKALHYACNHFDFKVHGNTNGFTLVDTKRISRYISGTRDSGILYSKSHDFILVGYIDSYFAGSIDDKKTHLGIFSILVQEQSHGLPKNNPLLLFQLQKQKMQPQHQQHVKQCG